MTPTGFLGRVLWWAGALAIGGEGTPGGVALGAGLGCLNIAALGHLGGRLVRPGDDRRRWVWALLLALKFALFLGVVGWALWALPVDPLGMAVGLLGPMIAVGIGGWTWYRAGGLETPPGDESDRGRSS